MGKAEERRGMDRAVAGEESIIWFNVSPRLSDGMSDGCGSFFIACISDERVSNLRLLRRKRILSNNL